MKALTLVHSFAMVLSTWVTMLAGIMMMSCKVPSGHIDEKASERCFWPIYLRSNVRELAPIDAYSAWLITRGGALLYTSDGGKNWEPIAKGIKDNITDASFINLYQGWILSNKGEIWKTVNAGVNWMKLETLTIVDHDYAQIHFIDADHGWVIDQTVIWLTRDGGFTWGKHKIAISPLAPRVFALDFISPLRGWLCGEGGMLYRTLDGGISWQTVKVSDEDTIFDNIVFTSTSSS